MQLTHYYINVIDRVNRFIYPLIAGLMGFVALVLFIQVILRYVVHAPLVWSEEVAKYLSIWIVFLGMAIAMRKMLLIAVEALIQSVPPKLNRLMRVLVLLLVMAFLSYLTYIGVIVTYEAGEQNFASLELPMSLAYAAIPIGSFLTLLNAIVVLIELFTGTGDRS